ncbi:efflux RND transporter permease subunit [Escherichia coli]
MAANKDAISRTSGVGDVQLFGSQYAMRIWMNPNELNKFQLTPVDVITAIKARRPGCGGSARWYAAGERPTA